MAAWRFKPRLERADLPDLPMSAPRTKLLSFDWEWHGLVDPFEIPGPLPQAA
jgi:hypothetical protein